LSTEAVKLNPATSRHSNADVEAAMSKFLSNARDRGRMRKQRAPKAADDKARRSRAMVAAAAIDAPDHEDASQL